MVASLLAGCSSGTPPVTHGKLQSYDSAVLALRPVAYYHMSGLKDSEVDLAGGRHPGTWSRSRIALRRAALPDGTKAVDFRPGDYLTIPNAPGFSIPTTGQFTVISWIRPDTLQFDHETGSGYVYWLGKGASGNQEWALRMYSHDNAESRPNRISAYVFNSIGGEGSGAYFQGPVTVARWIMVTVEVSTEASQRYPSGWVAIYRDGAFVEQVSLNQFNVTPGAGPAPVRVGTRNLESYFQGAIGDVAVFDHVISPGDVASLYGIMTKTTAPGS